MTAVCEICPRHCAIAEGRTGFCRARASRGGEVVGVNYGKITALALDPIEKKPLHRFFPGSMILSAGSFGCNLACPFCQNSDISMAGEDGSAFRDIPPLQLAEQAAALREQGNIGIALTYNEPLVGYEYALDVFRIAREMEMKTVLVTNGYAERGPWEALLGVTDALNIDLKGFNAAFYRKIGGDIETVKQNIELAAGRCHVELTTLIVPGENDGVEEMEREAEWIAGISERIPLHISRFFPRYHMTDRGATPIERVIRLAQEARRHLRFVYEGNL